MRYIEIPLRDDGSATLCAYVLDSAISTGLAKVRPCMVVCPGGAYLSLATREGEVVAARWLGMGYQVCIVRYKHYVVGVTKGPDGSQRPVCDQESHYPEQLIDLMRAMEEVHAHADEWGIDANRVYAMGFSAGGHLVGSLAERWDDTRLLVRAGATALHARPRGVVMCYPMVTARILCEESTEGVSHSEDIDTTLVSKAIFGTSRPTQAQFDELDLISNARPNMPRLFVWQGGDDDVVSPRETVAFVAAAMAQGVHCELHLYEHGHHGTSLCDTTSAARPRDIRPDNAGWVEACRLWLERDGADAEISHPV